MPCRYWSESSQGVIFAPSRPSPQTFPAKQWKSHRIATARPVEQVERPLLGRGVSLRCRSSGDRYITAVWVYGSRDGDGIHRIQTFDIALSGADAKLISIGKGRYRRWRMDRMGGRVSPFLRGCHQTFL